jgi:hypothetical protein
MEYNTQNDLLLNKLMQFYHKDDNFEQMLEIINGQSKISLRIVDWFATNYSKKYYTVYSIPGESRFKVYNDYKLKLKAYSKKRFDPFCRWERITIPFKNDTFIQTTIGQLNFFKWALENDVITYITENYKAIDVDMNVRNSVTKAKNFSISSTDSNSSSSSNDSICSNISNTSTNSKTRKKREELSSNASKGIKKEEVSITVNLS